MSNQAKVSSNPFDIFVIGARKGFNIAINNLMPNVLMAYVIAEMLNLVPAGSSQRSRGSSCSN